MTRAKTITIAVVLTVLAGVIVALAFVIPSQQANAGIGFTGYSQIAQTALQKAGKPFGYKVACHPYAINYATASFKITCTMTETGR